MATVFRLLGFVGAFLDGRALDLGPARQRSVLTVLLVDANHGVSSEQLIERVWGDQRPRRAHENLYSYVSRLRQILAQTNGDARLSRSSGGYLLQTDTASIDLHLFQRLVAEARQTSDDAEAANALHQALRLWHGEAFGALDTPWLNHLRENLETERQAAELDYAELFVRLGRQNEVLPRLSAAAADRPLDERLAGLLMRAHLQSGRQAEALNVFHTTRAALVAELGVNPGQALQQLHHAILTADPLVGVEAPNAPVAFASSAQPANLNPRRRFGILGPLQVRSAAGEEVVVSGRRQRALLTLLLLEAGRTVSMDRLLAGQYAEHPPAGATNALQGQISRLRRELPAGIVEFHGSGYRLAVDPDEVDVHRFERLAREGRRLLAAGTYDAAAAVLREALALWRGPALADLPHGTAQVASLDQARLAASEDLFEAELALPGGTSVAELVGLVAAHPFRERLRGLLMRALQLAGRQTDALQEYEELRRLLADEFGVDPSPELAAIHRAILDAETGSMPTRRGPPTQLTSFVGRDSELARLAGLAGARMVTITGPGGTGKTRLAVEAAHRSPRMACFVDLSSVADGNGITGVILDALGVREAGFPPGGMDPLRRLVAALEGDLLLVLDNCEHVVSTVAVLARRLLADCPSLRILATSREPLGLTGEMLLPLEPLPDAPAVRLFADRAAAVRPSFELGSDNADDVAAVCTTLDGLPLAIELAAARMREFTLTELARRLAEHGRFRLLSRGDRTAAARHQTLAAAVEWSWDLLSPGQRQLATRLAVFCGGATLAAVEAVCAVPDADELLADLVDKSIVEREGSRYRMLETIRLFCAERLAAAGEVELRLAHARYYLSLAQQADPELRRAAQLEWLATLRADHDNLMAALRFAATEERETGFRLVASLAAYLWLSGRRRQVGAAAALLLQGDPPPPDLAEEYVACVVHAVPRARQELWDRASAIMDTLDHPLRYPFGAMVWGMNAGPPKPSAVNRRSLPETDAWSVAVTQQTDALSHLLGGQPAKGERLLLKVLDQYSSLGERCGTAQTMDFLAQAASWRGDWARADGLWSNALYRYEELGALQECADVMSHRADSLLRQGYLDLAESVFRRAAELSAQGGERSVVPGVLLGLAEIAQLRGDEAGATEQLAKATTAFDEGGFRFSNRRARLLSRLGRHVEAVEAARRSPFVVDLAEATEGLAGMVLERGQAERAALLLGVAVNLRGLAVAGDHRVARIEASARELLGSVAFEETYSRGIELNTDEALRIVDGFLRLSSSMATLWQAWADVVRITTLSYR